MTRVFDRRMLRRGELIVVLFACGFVAATVIAAAWSGADVAIARVISQHPGLIAAMLALSLVNFALRTLRWLVFSRHLGIEVPPRRASLFYVAGFSMTTTPGKLGELLRLWLMERSNAIRYQRAVPLIIGDRVGDVIALVLLCLIGVVAFDRYRTALLAATLVVTAVVLLLLTPRVGVGLTTAAYALVRRARRFFAGLRTAVRRTAGLFAPRIFVISLCLGAAGWCAEAFAFHLVLERLGADMAMTHAMFIFAFSMIVGGVSMLPGGVGGAEASMFGLLIAAGVDEATAIAATALSRLTGLWFAVALGFVTLPAALGEARAPGGQPARPAASGTPAARPR
jgi:uncharacterized protein (TIRG00374 family)